MADIKKLLESFDSMSKAEKKSSGPKFPGYWKGKDSASKSRSRMVGSMEESVIKELHNTTTSTEFKLQEQFNQFKQAYGEMDPTIANMPKAEVDKQIGSMAAATKPAYTGIDPIVRQRMGMQPATQDEVGSYLDKNPQFVTTRDGQPVRTGSGAPVVSGGLTTVGRAADAASPDRERAEAMPAPAQIQQRPSITLPPVAGAPSTTTQTTVAPTKPAAPVAAKPTIPQMPKNPASGSWQDVWKNNPQLKNPNMIQVGQQITMPNGVKVTVNKGDTLDKLAKQYRLGDFNVDESAGQEKIADRYNADDFDDMVLRVKKLAHKQEKKQGPVDLAKLAKRLAALDKKEPVTEYDNAQDPNAQVTSPSDPKPSTASQQSQQQQNMKDQAVDMATAKSTTTTLKNVLGPKFDPNAAATAIVKANDGKAMSPQEQQAMGSITPLVMKAAETPAVSGQLKSALQNAGNMAKQGK